METLVRAGLSNAVSATVLAVEQNAGVALAVADHAFVLEVGRVCLDGPCVDLRRDESVRRSYLGY